MKKFLLIIPALLLTASTFAQGGVSTNYLEAYFDSTGMISYRTHGDITKDGVVLADMKITALNNYAVHEHPSPTQLDLIQKEKSDIENLRQRILAQRERMMQPLPPMQEMH